MLSRITGSARRAAAALLPLVAACASVPAAAPAAHTLRLTGVERTITRPGAPAPDRSRWEPQAGAFHDSLVAIAAAPHRAGFYLSIDNTADVTVRLPWDDAAVIGLSGATMRVMHLGTRYVDRNAPQAPTVIARGARLDDQAIPSELVAYVPYVGWQARPMLPALSAADEGRHVGLLVPLQVGDARAEYLLTFTVVPARMMVGSR